MSKEMIIIALGIFVVAVPYLGIPGEWRVGLLVLSGLGIAVTGFLLRGEALARGGRPHAHNPFVESNQPERHENQQGINSLN